MTPSSRIVRLRRVAATVLALALASAMLLLIPGRALAGCADKVRTFPAGQLERGMRGHGLTVVKGREPAPFSIRILGVLRDGAGPGLDIIVVKGGGKAVRASGGFAGGFSGSPVYIDGRLVGSLSYGFGDPYYGGLTPAKNLVSILRTGSSPKAAREVVLPDALRRLIARDSGTPLRATGTTLRTLPLPLAVSGVPAGHLDEVQARFAAQGIDVIPYVAGAAAARRIPIEAKAPQPGDVFVAAQSYGAVTYAGIGTATLSCGNRVVAFGHLFAHAGGGRSAAMMGGKVITVVPTDGPYPGYKLANVGSLLGSITQDRYTGVMGAAGVEPLLATLRSTVHNTDLDRRTVATTQVATPRYVAYIAWEHVYTALHVGLDDHNGTVRFSWRVTGVADGRRFSTRMHNLYSGGSVLYEPAGDVEQSIRTIERSAGKVTISAVRMHAVVQGAVRKARVEAAKTWSNTESIFAKQRVLRVHRGDEVRVRIPVVPRNGDPTRIARVVFTVPQRVTEDGTLVIKVGEPSYETRHGGFRQVLYRLRNQPTNEDLFLRFKMKGMEHSVKVTLPQGYDLRGHLRDVHLEFVG